MRWACPGSLSRTSRVEEARRRERRLRAESVRPAEFVHGSFVLRLSRRRHPPARSDPESSWNPGPCTPECHIPSRVTSVRERASGKAVGSFYKVSAVDFNGNESGFALLEPGGISGVADDGRIPGLAVTVANPMVGRFEVSFSLASERPARLSLFDVAGRLVTSRDVMLSG